MVAVSGFLTCGDQCDDIIINRQSRPGEKDYLMDLSKLALMVCLVVGIVIRNQANKAGIFSIIEQFKNLGDDIPVQKSLRAISYEKVAVYNDVGDISSLKINQESLSPTTSATTTHQKDTKFSSITTTVVQLINSLLPAITAILVKDNLINYVESGSGFLAPVFMIIYPCKSLISRHNHYTTASARQSNGI